jgi:hypothetical protein
LQNQLIVCTSLFGFKALRRPQHPVDIRSRGGCRGNLRAKAGFSAKTGWDAWRAGGSSEGPAVHSSAGFLV